MKKTICVFLLAVLMLTAAVASAVEYPVYGACSGEQVNVRKQPDEKVPSYGRLIHNAPVVVLGEEGDTYLCDTVFGEGYVPKQYIKLFEDMTEAQFEQYSIDHPNFYRKVDPNKVYYSSKNNELWLAYERGQISEEELKKQWDHEPKTGYTGLRSDGNRLWVFRRDWW